MSNIFGIKISLGVLLGYIITAAIATPAVTVAIDDLISGKPIPVGVIEAAAAGIAGFLANTVIHQTTGSSGSTPVNPDPPAAKVA
jgi:hypothetical protein